MSARKTAWHPPFTGWLLEASPRWTAVRGEVNLTSEPLRIDDVIELRADHPRDPADTGRTLHGLWALFLAVCLLEYKSPARPFRRGDLHMLLAYGMLWLAERQARPRQPDGSHSERLSAHEVTLALAVPSINDALRDELLDLGLVLPHSNTGYYVVTGLPQPLVVVDLSVVAEHEDDDVLRWFAGQRVRTLATRRWVGQHHNRKDDAMSTQATPDLEGYEEFAKEYLSQFSLEERLAGLKPEDIAHALKPEDVVRAFKPEDIAHALKPEDLAHALKPEDRLVDLAPAQVVLALPLEVLRALSPAYLATLPEDVQATVRARLRA